MIDVKTIPSMLCSDLVAHVLDVAGKLCIVTPLTYPNGDSINVYLMNSKDEILSSDEGATRDNLLQGGVKLTEEKIDFIGSICRVRNASYSARRITKLIRPKSVGDDIFGFCQAVSDVANLHYHVHSMERTHFHETVDGFVRRKIEPVCDVQREWTNPEIDPRKSFPVDYRINGTGRAPKNIFYVTSPGKAWQVTAVSNFLLSHNIRVPTLTIIDDSAGIKGKQIDRLQLSSTSLLFGVKGNERKISNFALRAA